MPPPIRKVKHSGTNFFILNLPGFCPLSGAHDLKFEKSWKSVQDEALRFGHKPLYLNGEQTLLPLGLLTRETFSGRGVKLALFGCF